jgi:hypothetical protein
MRRVPRVILALLAASALAFTLACDNLEEPETQDIVSTIPWGDNETLTYRLYEDDELIGSTTLTVERDGETYILTQRSTDPDGNIDEASVVVDDETLKPFTGTRNIVDSERREVAASCYEYVGGHECGDDVDATQCDDEAVVRIEERVYKPPDESTPDVPRRAPLCIPPHAYDNDTSLFIWRTIPFAEDYLANYKTVLTGTRRTQTVRIEVISRTTDTPLGERDAWLVQISADGKNQRAWFDAESPHEILAYQNEGFTFELEE